MKKRVLAVALVVAMVGSMLAGCSKSSESADTNAAANGAKVVKIGVYEPASGDNGAGGKQETLGIQYANQATPTVEIGGEEYTVQLEIVDNESSNDNPSYLVPMVPVYPSQHLTYSRMQEFRLWVLPVQTRRLPKAISITSVSASWIRSRVPYWQTLQTRTSAQRRLTS